MAEGSIPVDLFNPGQVFASLGFMEAAETLLGEAEATFDWSRPGATRFVLRAKGDEDPFAHVLEFLATAEVFAEAPHGSDATDKWAPGWGTLEELPAGAAYPFEAPSSPGTFVASLRAGERRLRLQHWGDTQRDNAKFWGGSGGYPGAALARDALDLARPRCVEVVTAPFDFAARQSSSFRLDWRRDYIPIDTGFSLNMHKGKGKIDAVGYPLVELLGALGLSDARPLRGVDKLKYRYGIIGRADPKRALTFLPPALLRAALGAAELPFATRRFRLCMARPDEYARSITTVTEETSA
jgi:CRISPR-associated protein Csx14